MNIDIETIGSQKVKKLPTGESVELKSLWKGQDTAVIFFRRWGCVACRLWAKELSEIAPVLKENNVKLFGVGVEEAGSQEFLDRKFFDGDLYHVEKQSTYADLGFKRFNTISILMSLFWKQTREAISKGKSMDLGGDSKGDWVQTGGAILLNKEGKILRHFVQTGPGDHLPNLDILKAFGLEHMYKAEKMANQEQDRACKEMKAMKLSEFNNSKKITDDSRECHFTRLLRTRWDEIHAEPDVFRYKIDRMQEKTVGEYLLQLNPKRSSQRRAPEHVEAVSQPFDSSRFNFTQASPRELLFNVVQDGDVEWNIHAVLVNVSPISRYHSLLVPSAQRCLPQVVTEESLLLILDIMFTSRDLNLRIGFNSLCAFASVNHLHYHLFLESRTLPVDTAECERIKGDLHRLSDYPAPAFCFDIPHKQYIAQIARDTHKIVEYFLQNRIAHNLMVTRRRNGTGDVRVVLWPRKSSTGAKEPAAFNVATCELSGWFPIYNAQNYDSLTKEDLENQLRKWKWDDFEKLCENVKSLL